MVRQTEEIYSKVDVGLPDKCGQNLKSCTDGRIFDCQLDVFLDGKAARPGAQLSNLRQLRTVAAFNYGVAV